MINTTAGNWAAFGGLIVLVLSHFGIVINENEVVTVIAGIVALMGIIRQVFVTKKVVGMARSLGATNLK